jgi:hypothetical protein
LVCFLTIASYALYAGSKGRQNRNNLKAITRKKVRNKETKEERKKERKKENSLPSVPVHSGNLVKYDDGVGHGRRTWQETNKQRGENNTWW